MTQAKLIGRSPANQIKNNNLKVREPGECTARKPCGSSTYSVVYLQIHFISRSRLYKNRHHFTYSIMLVQLQYLFSTTTRYYDLLLDIMICLTGMLYVHSHENIAGFSVTSLHGFEFKALIC